MNVELDFVYIHDPENRNDFFGELKYARLPNGNRQVELVVMPGDDAGAEFAVNALAIDGSSSMTQEFGRHLPPILQKQNNKVQPFAQALGGFLAKNSLGKCGLAYWACGDDGTAIEPVGMYSREEYQSLKVAGPGDFGGATRLAPIVRYLWDQVFAEAERPGVAVVLTDGMWADQADVLKLTQQICDEVASERRKLMKIVLLIYVTDATRTEDQLARIEDAMNEVDDYDSGTEIDVWDHKWVDYLTQFGQIYIELVKDWPLGVGGNVVDPSGTSLLARDEFKFGISFELPAGAQSFKLILDGAGEYEQAIPD
jgi:hypothetical protein